jgi:2-haloacid dehalogenase
MKYSLLLFDLDDTLFDYDKAEEFALNTAFNSANIELDDKLRNLYRIINKSLWNRLESGTITTDEIRIQRFQLLVNEQNLRADPHTLADTYLSSFASVEFLCEGAVEILEYFKQTHTLAAVTNGIKDTQMTRISKTGLDKYLKFTVTSEDAGYAKPDLRFFTYIEKNYTLPPKEEILIIGDNLESDIRGGVNFSIDTCWYNPKKKLNESTLITSYEIGSLYELKSIF